MSDDGAIRKDFSAADALRIGEAAGALKPGESEYRRIVENAPVGIVQATPEGRIITANPALARILGYGSVDELLRTAPSMVSHYADVAGRSELIHQLQKHGAVVDYEIQMRRKDGNLIWVSVDIQVVRDEHGVQHYYGSVEDVTERKRAEEVVWEAASRAWRRRRITVAMELSILGGLTVLFFGFAARFDWFEVVTGWFQVSRTLQQLDDLVLAALFLVVGLSVFAFRRWRESETEVTSQREVQVALRLLHGELDVRVKQRTAELREANDALRAEAVERSRAEAALCLPNAALTAAANAIVITDRDGTIVWANPAFRTLTGYTLAEAVGKNPRDLVKSGQQVHEVYQNLWETILAGRVWHGELVNRRKDGSLYPEELTITPVRDANSEITHFIALKQDLSERKHAEEALQQSEERYRLLFERAPDVIFAVGPTGTITSLNHAFETINGWPPAQWLGRSFQELIHPDDQTRTGELFQLVLRGERAPTFELRVRTAAGGFRDVEITGFSSQLSGGRIEVQGIGRDITERKRNEYRLRRLTDCLLTFGVDPLENINRLTALCGEMLGATCALYNRIEGGLLCSLGRWHTPPDYVPQDRPEGHICYDVIRQGGDDLLVVRNLPETAYFATDPNVARFNLKTYVGKAVVFSDTRVGSLCAVFDRDFEPDETDRAFVTIVAAAIGIEEERRHAGHELQKSEERFRLLVENAPDAIFVQTQHRFVFLNPAALRCFGAESPGQLLGQPVLDRFDARFHAQVTERMRLLNEEKKPVPTLEQIYLKLDGSTFDVETSAAPIRWGDHDGALVFFRDITERKRAEKEILSLARFADENPSPVLRVARDGRLLYANRSSQRLLEHWHCAQAGQSLPEAECGWIAETLERGAGQGHEVTCGEVLYSLELAPIPEIGYVNIYGRDITKRKRAEEELLASREQMRALAAHLQTVREEERTRVAREIHDVLAQELTRLKIDLVWLQRRLAKPGKAGATESLTARVAEMSQMADAAIHCVQRIATGLRPAVLDSLGLCAAVEWQARDFQTHAKIKCHASVPEEELPVGRDAATAVFRILQESLTNVQRHAHATRVEVSLRQEAGQLILRVEDDGRGIRPETLNNPMSIGLAGMRERALLLGGQLEIRSQPGSGTTVTVRLPMSDE